MNKKDGKWVQTEDGSLRWDRTYDGTNHYGEYVLLLKTGCKSEELNNAAMAIEQLMDQARRTLAKMQDREYITGSGEIIIKEATDMPSHFSVGIKYSTYLIEETGTD